MAIQSVRNSHGYLTFNERVMWCERAWICASIKYFLFIFSTSLHHSTHITLHRSSSHSAECEVVFTTNFYYYKLFTNASERDWSSHMSWNEAKLCNWKNSSLRSMLLFNFKKLRWKFSSPLYARQTTMLGDENSSFDAQSMYRYIKWKFNLTHKNILLESFDKFSVEMRL